MLIQTMFMSMSILTELLNKKGILMEKIKMIIDKDHVTSIDAFSNDELSKMKLTQEVFLNLVNQDQACGLTMEDILNQERK